MKWCMRHPNGPLWLANGAFYSHGVVCKECQYREKLESVGYAVDIEKQKWRLGHKWHSTKAGAAKRGIDFFLTREQFADILAHPCIYGTWVHSSITPVGVDRMDNSAGYVPWNCVPCCGHHNQIKGSWASYGDMLRLVQMFPSAQACGVLKRRKTYGG